MQKFLLMTKWLANDRYLLLSILSKHVARCLISQSNAKKHAFPKRIPSNPEIKLPLVWASAKLRPNLFEVIFTSDIIPLQNKPKLSYCIRKADDDDVDLETLFTFKLDFVIVSLDTIK